MALSENQSVFAGFSDCSGLNKALQPNAGAAQ
jgi:hypothetical protein